VVTDHGFLLLPSEAVHDRENYELGTGQYRDRGERWAALKQDAHVHGMITRTVPLDPNAGKLGFPRGVQTFTKPAGYMHGGISLQECVVPHLESRVAVFEPVKLDVRLVVNSETLTTGTISAVLQGTVSGGQQSLEAPEPVAVQVWVEVSDSGERVTETETYTLGKEYPQHMVGLFLPEGVGLSSGTQLVLRAVERDTQRELDRVPLTLAIDWE
jgi:hypothetical protein